MTTPTPAPLVPSQRDADVMIGSFIAQWDEAADGCMMDADTAQALAREFKRMRELIYIPGVWRCAKCNFRLIQSNLNAHDGTVTARDDPGEKCPNDGSPMWRVTYRDDMADAYDRWQEQVNRAVAAERKVERLEAEIRAEQSSPAGDMDRPAILAAARAWWAASMPMSICRSIQISGDGRVNVHWQDADESGKYTLPVGFFNRSNPGADVERLRAALDACGYQRVFDALCHAVVQAEWHYNDRRALNVSVERFIHKLTGISREEALATPTRDENAQVRGDGLMPGDIETLGAFLAAYSDQPDYLLADRSEDDDILTWGNLRRILAALTATPQAPEPDRGEKGQ